MINRLYSSLKSFKELQFHNGLNIVLADRTAGATDRQTRNAAGKSSIIETIHFLMGANCDRDSLFSQKELSPYSFGIDFQLDGSSTQIERSPAEKNEIAIRFANTEKWPITPHTNKANGKEIMSVKDWNSVLGQRMFNLDFGRQKYSPTFRSLFSYFARRQYDGGIVEPTKQSDMQQLWDQQVAVTFLFGLDWTLAKQWQILRDKERILRTLKGLTRIEDEPEWIASAAQLRTQLYVAEEKSNKLKKSLAEFKVLPEYHDLENEASDLARGISHLSNENFVDTELISDIRASFSEEREPPFSQLTELYEEIGIFFTPNIKHRFEETRVFHQSIIKNRKSYLEGELRAAGARISARNAKLVDMAERQAEIMGLLTSHGALDQYTQLHSELARIEAKTESIRQRYKAAQEFENGKNELDIQKGKLQLRLKQEIQERHDLVRRATMSFEGFSSSLYEKAGSLSIDDSRNGPEFRVSIQGLKSKGIGNMQIFCFDMMLMQMCQERRTGPGVLVHDSHLFDGTDGRQIQKALEIGARMSASLGFQYIVTMNSDVATSSLAGEFIEKHAISTKLTDATSDGGLFGIRF